MAPRSLHSASNRSPSDPAVENATISFGPLQVVLESEAPRLIDSLRSIYSGGVMPLEIEGLSGETSQRTIGYQILKAVHGNASIDSYTVIRDGEVLYRNYGEEALTNCLEWDISNATSKALTRYHLIHAGAVAHNGHGVLFPGGSGVGKSTTIAALTLEGFAYCSDELAVVGPNFRLYPFPKIISLKSGGWRQIVRDFPEAVSGLGWPNISGGGVWQVRPPLIPNSHLAQEGYSLDFVVLPRYQPGQESKLQPISRSLALKALVEQSLDLQLRKEEGFETLVELARRADCYSLSVFSLKEAAVLVKELTL